MKKTYDIKAGGGLRIEPTTIQNQTPLIFRDNKQPSSDVADVLLSLKHAVVHPGQYPNEKYEAQHVHHPQMLLSPGGYAGGICEQNFGQQPPPMFPSMSVNVSMNMTMHGYHPNNSCGYASTDIQCPQVQWSSTPQATPPGYQSQGLLSPSYGGTYSFTADFRPPQEAPVLSSSYKTVPMSFASPRRRHSISLFEEESQKPNVCRICGEQFPHN
ncbi:hypothetical protein JTB14_035761 [Gonioctena quinquepunctata]|nr:hypothetical protein JTB14_035761 [Gonioctena quinquepunctata]